MNTRARSTYSVCNVVHCVHTHTQTKHTQQCTVHPPASMISLAPAKQRTSRLYALIFNLIFLLLLSNRMRDKRETTNHSHYRQIGCNTSKNGEHWKWVIRKSKPQKRKRFFGNADTNEIGLFQQHSWLCAPGKCSIRPYPCMWKFHQIKLRATTDKVWVLANLQRLFEWRWQCVIRICWCGWHFVYKRNARRILYKKN